MTLCIIQARLGSTRLPRKALKWLGDQCVIDHVLDRVEEIPSVDHYVLAVPTGDADIHAWATEIPGDPNDVLGRFVKVLEDWPDADTIVRVTGDCPLLNPEVCERVIQLYRATPGCEYAWTNTRDGDWPDGLDCEVFSADALRWAHRMTQHPYDREHVTPWIRRNCKSVSLPPDPKFHGGPKVSIDTMEDYERVKQMVEEGC